MLKYIDNLHIFGFLVDLEHALDIDISLIKSFLVSNCIEFLKLDVFSFPHGAVYRGGGVREGIVKAPIVCFLDFAAVLLDVLKPLTIHVGVSVFASGMLT